MSQPSPRLLLERDDQLDGLSACLADAKAGHGRLALVTAEAGGGKTALVERFCAERAAGLPVLWGCCDPLSTPRPLGPLLDIAAAYGGDLGRLARESPGADALVDPLLARLAGAQAPQVLVLEDAHWADEATLDFLRLIGRRVGRTRTLLIVTYRDDETGPRHPLRAALGDLSAAAVVRRQSLPALSPAAVEVLAHRFGRDAGELHARTGGNPFFVTEVLAAEARELPETVRDAVLARAARLSSTAREALDAVAIVPGRAESWLVSALCGPAGDALAECVAAGMLVELPDALAFRHELARLAVGEAVPLAALRRLHARVLALLETPPDGPPDMARLSHHAEAAGGAEEVLRYAPAAAARAGALGAHREAAAQFRRALRFAHGRALAERVGLLEAYSHECFLTDELEDAVDARREAIEGRRAIGDRRGEGDGLVRLSHYLWPLGRRDEAETTAEAAIELLETLRAGRELAMAYSERSRLRMLVQDTDAAVTWGMRAIELGERLGATEILVHGLNNVGTAELQAGIEAGREKVERSLALASKAGLEDDVGRAYNNLGAIDLQWRRLDLAERWLTEGLEYAQERELDSWIRSMSGDLAWVRLLQGHFDEAERLAEVAEPADAAPGIPWARGVAGRVRARRGDDPWPSLDLTSVPEGALREPQVLATLAAARAEAAWLDGDDARAVSEAERALQLIVEVRDPWHLGELTSWMRRAGAPFEDPGSLPEPYVLEAAGRWHEAAAAWDALGCPYEAALCRGESDEPAVVRAAMDALDRLGASATAARVGDRLRARGGRLPPGRRPASGVGELTSRELEVLAAMASGASNREIGRRLVISEATAARHVANIFAKLGVSRRAQAVGIAVDRGLVEPGRPEQ